MRGIIKKIRLINHSAMLTTTAHSTKGRDVSGGGERNRRPTNMPYIPQGEMMRK